MVDRLSPPLPGRATAAGTRAFASRAPADPSFFRSSLDGLTVSSFGIGTYKGAPTDAGDQVWSDALDVALDGGVNLFDTAVRYRGMRSERVLGAALDRACRSGRHERAGIVVSTKGGLLPFPSDVPRDEALAALLAQAGLPASAVPDGDHCIHPAMIEVLFDLSRQNLGVSTIDVYFLHNPEQALLSFPESEVHDMIAADFEVLEARVAAGELGAYGIASWNGFRRRPGSAVKLDLDRLLSLAEQVGGPDHHLRWLEVPLSLGMPWLATTGAEELAAAAARCTVLASAPLYEGHLEVLLDLARLARLAGRADSAVELGGRRLSLPESENSTAQLLAALLGARQADVDLGALLLDATGRTSPYVGALDLVRSTPGITAALVGADAPSHVRDHLELRGRSVAASDVARVWRAVSPSEGPGAAPS